MSCEAPKLPSLKPGVNPFPIYQDLATRIVFPPIPLWCLPLLVLLALWRALMMIACISIVVIPIWRGKASRQKHLWLFRTHYPSIASRRNGVPYIVPNRGLIVAVCEFFSSGLYLMLACFNYKSFTTPAFTEKISLTLWYGIAWLPSYVGIWLSGWGLCHACLCNGQQAGKKIPNFLSPVLFNFMWSSWLLVILITHAVCATLLTQATIVTYHHFDNLQAVLKKAREEWTPDSRPNVRAMAAMLKELNGLLINCKVVEFRMGTWYIFWIVFGVVLACFYIFTAQYLVRLVRNLLQKCQTQALACRENVGTRRGGEVPAKEVVSKTTTHAITELRREFRFLAAHSILITLVLICEVAVPAYQVGLSHHIASSAWRTGSAIIVMAPSTFISPALLFQSWRLLSEHNNAEESELNQALSETDDIQLPIFAAQFLHGRFSVDAQAPDAFAALPSTSSTKQSSLDVKIVRCVSVFDSSVDKNATHFPGDSKLFSFGDFDSK